MTHHVIISGVTSCENRGVEALVRSIVEGLGILGPRRTTVLTQTPDQDSALLGPTGVDCVADPFVVSKSLRATAPESKYELAAVRKQLLATADLVVTTGGDLHTSDYGVSTKYLAAPTVAQEHNVPVAMLAHSVGPFTNPAEASEWCAAARQSAVLTTRETISWRYLVEDLGLSENRVALGADPAFLLRAAPADRIDEILTVIGIEPGRPYVCLAPSKGIAAFRGLSEQGHLSALLSLINSLVTRWRLPVLFLPHVHDSRPHNDDRRLVAELAEDIDHPTVRAVPGTLTAAEYKGITARSAITVAERMHAAIGTLSSGVPTVAVGYSRKFVGILSDTYGDAVPLDQVHLDVESFVNDDEAGTRLVEGIDLMAMRAALDSRLGIVRSRARSNFARLAEVVGGAA